MYKIQYRNYFLAHCNFDSQKMGKNILFFREKNNYFYSYFIVYIFYF